jgi:hypothetical protein
MHWQKLEILIGSKCTRSCSALQVFYQLMHVVNSTKTLDLIPNFLDFFRRLYAPVSDHVTPALTLAEMPH